MAAITTWNIAPDYDAWGSDTWWDCNEWMQWHAQLKNHFGREIANQIWDYAFAKQGQFSGALDCRTFNTKFRQYVRAEGLNPYANAGALQIILNPSGSLLELLGGASDAIGGAGEGVGSLGKVLKYLVPVAILGAGIYFGVKIYKTLK